MRSILAALGKSAGHANLNAVAKVYLETSFFSACVSRRTDPRTAGWKVSSNEWWSREAKRHELFVSAEVLNELSAPDFPDSAAANPNKRRHFAIVCMRLGFAAPMIVTPDSLQDNDDE